MRLTGHGGHRWNNDLYQPSRLRKFLLFAIYAIYAISLAQFRRGVEFALSHFVRARLFPIILEVSISIC